jgi:glycosyltransferase involved in cell wall biosynthesis
MQRYGYRPRIRMSEQRESELLDRYDGVICIQRDDHAIVGNWLGERKAILAPHPTAITPQAFRREVKRIGFVASDWFANVEGLQWFLREVWPAFTQRGVSLDVHGSIERCFTGDQSPGVSFHGHADSLPEVYGNIDIVINPARFGSGLKIKTVEALGNGLPLVTTSEGARGLTDADGDALLIADDAASFIDALDALLNSPALRQRIGAGALDYARKHFSPEACFGALIARINAA